MKNRDDVPVNYGCRLSLAHFFRISYMIYDM